MSSSVSSSEREETAVQARTQEEIVTNVSETAVVRTGRSDRRCCSRHCRAARMSWERGGGFRS